MSDYTIFVDDARIPAKVGRLNRRWSHLSVLPWTYESIRALHDFAQKIGLNRAWFQKGTLPHYDVTDALRERAIKAGAIDVTWRQMAEMTRPYIKKRGGAFNKVFCEEMDTI